LENFSRQTFDVLCSDSVLTFYLLAACGKSMGHISVVVIVVVLAAAPAAAVLVVIVVVVVVVVVTPL
jgi:hypothetical protein